METIFGSRAQTLIEDESGEPSHHTYAYWSDETWEVASGAGNLMESSHLLSRFERMRIESNKSGPRILPVERRESVRNVDTISMIPDHVAIQITYRGSSSDREVPKWAGRPTRVGEVWSMADPRAAAEGDDPVFEDASVFVANDQVSAIVTAIGPVDVLEIVDGLVELSAELRQ